MNGRATTASGAAPVGDFGGVGTNTLAPWLQQSQGNIGFTPRDMRLGNPGEFDQQLGLADGLRGQTMDQWRQSKLPAAQPGWAPGQAGTAEGGMTSGLFSPEQNLAALKNQYANRELSGPSNYDAGHMDYSGDVPQWVGGAGPGAGGYNWQGMADQFNPLVPTENKFSNWYYQNEGDPREGERIFDRKWLSEFDDVSKRPEIVSMYGKPPANATDQEKLDYMSLVNFGGTTEAARQATIAENKKTEMQEAAVMMAVGGALGGAAAGMGASGFGGTMGATGGTTGTLGSLGAYAPSAWQAASAGAQGAFGMGGDMPQQLATANALRSGSGAVAGSPYAEWLKSLGR